MVVSAVSDFLWLVKTSRIFVTFGEETRGEQMARHAAAQHWAAIIPHALTGILPHLPRSTLNFFRLANIHFGSSLLCVELWTIVSGRCRPQKSQFAQSPTKQWSHKTWKWSLERYCGLISGCARLLPVCLCWSKSYRIHETTSWVWFSIAWTSNLQVPFFIFFLFCRF